MYSKDSKSKQMSVDGKAGQEQRIMSIKCAVSRKLFRQGLTKELSSLQKMKVFQDSVRETFHSCRNFTYNSMEALAHGGF